MGLRDWLPRIRQKASSVTRLIVELVGVGDPVYTPRDYYNLAKEGFEKNVYVYAAIDRIAKACSGIPWLLYQKGRDGKLTEIEGDHPLLKLIRRPNPEQGQGRFIYELVSYHYLAGNAYVEAVGPETRKGPPIELWNLRPDRVQVLPDSQNRIRGYRYTVGHRYVDLPREKVLHWKKFAAMDDWYGLSPVLVAARIVDQNNAADDWNMALMQNKAQPSLVLIAKSELSDDAYNRIKKQLRERWSGSRNAGLPQLLEGGLDVKVVSLSPAELDWIKSDINQGRKIAIALGVPPELLGDSTNKTYSNYREARAAFYQETILPLMDELRDELNNWLVPMFGDNLYLDYDRDEIEALQEDRKELVESLSKAWWLSINERRVMMGYGEVEGGDEIYIPANLQPLNAMGLDEPFGPMTEGDGNEAGIND